MEKKIKNAIESQSKFKNDKKDFQKEKISFLEMQKRLMSERNAIFIEQNEHKTKESKY